MTFKPFWLAFGKEVLPRELPGRLDRFGPARREEHAIHIAW